MSVDICPDLWGYFPRFLSIYLPTSIGISPDFYRYLFWAISISRPIFIDIFQDFHFYFDFYWRRSWFLSISLLISVDTSLFVTFLQISIDICPDFYRHLSRFLSIPFPSYIDISHDFSWYSLLICVYIAPDFYRYFSWYLSIPPDFWHFSRFLSISIYISLDFCRYLSRVISISLTAGLPPDITWNTPTNSSSWWLFGSVITWTRLLWQLCNRGWAIMLRALHVRAMELVCL